MPRPQPEFVIDLKIAAWVANSIGHQDIVDPGKRERFSFRNLLTADSDRSTMFYLIARRIGRFMHLSVHTNGNAGFSTETSHAFDVLLKGVEIDQQTRRLDILFCHSDFGRDVLANLQTRVDRPPIIQGVLAKTDQSKDKSSKNRPMRAAVASGCSTMGQCPASR